MNVITRVTDILHWHRQQLKNPSSPVLPIPVPNAWKTWDANRLWCAFFFSIISPGGSAAAREYLRRIEDGSAKFELNPELLAPLSRADRLQAIWNFGTGKNFLGKRMARFFSKPGNIGAPHNCESKLADAFDILEKKGFLNWFATLDALEDDRRKAAALEFLPGAKLKVSRDFLNNIGMTDSLIPLDVHILTEIAQAWGWDWNVPRKTPSNRAIYERIEDSVRDVAASVKCTVVEIDKAVVSWRLYGPAK
jgi:hypothetical protein